MHCIVLYGGQGGRGCGAQRGQAPRLAHVPVTGRCVMAWRWNLSRDTVGIRCDTDPSLAAPKANGAPASCQRAARRAACCRRHAASGEAENGRPPAVRSGNALLVSSGVWDQPNRPTTGLAAMGERSASCSAPPSARPLGDGRRRRKCPLRTCCAANLALRGLQWTPSGLRSLRPNRLVGQQTGLKTFN